MEVDADLAQALFKDAKSALILPTVIRASWDSIKITRTVPTVPIARPSLQIVLSARLQIAASAKLDIL
jgi:hypothetical protein